MKEYTFKYKSRRTTFTLIQAIVWLAFFCVLYFSKGKINWHELGFFILGLIYLVMWYRQITKQFGVLQQDRLTLYNEWFSSKVVDLSTIQEVRYFAGDYILKSNQKQEFRINTQVLAPSSLEKLEEVLSTYTTHVVK